MNVVREIQKLNELELKQGIPLSASWHAQYAHSPWIYAGGLPYDLTEGDVLCVFSQYGEIEFIHLLREKKTGKSMGSAFLKYEDARSCILAVDNFNGIQVTRFVATREHAPQACLPIRATSQILGRTLRVDHKLEYKPPKEEDDEDGTARLSRPMPADARGVGDDGTTGVPVSDKIKKKKKDKKEKKEKKPKKARTEHSTVPV